MNDILRRSMNVSLMINLRLNSNAESKSSRITDAKDLTADEKNKVAPKKNPPQILKSLDSLRVANKTMLLDHMIKLYNKNLSAEQHAHFISLMLATTDLKQVLIKFRNLP